MNFYQISLLKKFIFKTQLLDWQKLHDIALDIAKGIEYFHQGYDQRILYFDIKPFNVLLDRNFNPKITDFDFAKLCLKEPTIISVSSKGVWATLSIIKKFWKCIL